MKFTQKIFSVVAASAVLLSTVAPVFADTTLTISGNGSDSSNGVVVSQKSTTTVQQGNNATVQNNITSNAGTGGNTAEDNTGGNVTVNTGNATVHTNVANDLNKNAAVVACCSTAGNSNVKVSGNGSDSTNNVGLTKANTTNLVQTNDANVTNTVNANAKTGENNAKDNTGGTVKIFTGDATSTTGISTTANSNEAQIGGQPGSTGSNSLSAIISGNGSDSTNNIGVGQTNSSTVWQSNNAEINNTVKANAYTGRNTAEDNTGGDTSIFTGNASAVTVIDNQVNFNAANIDCACTTDATAKVAGNGTESGNNIVATLGSDQGIYQGGSNNEDKGLGNNAGLTNNVTTNGKSGYNRAGDNTGPVLTDPVWVITGDAGNSTFVNNSGNVNTVGATFGTGFPDFQFNFDWNSFWMNGFGN